MADKDKNKKVKGTLTWAESNSIKCQINLFDNLFLTDFPGEKTFPLDLVAFWDCHALHRLQAWRRDFAEAAPTWLDAVADFEAIVSLAVTAANNPEWCEPEIVAADAGVVLAADQLGHPLIPDGVRVNNNLSLNAGLVNLTVHISMNMLIHVKASIKNGAPTYLITQETKFVTFSSAMHFSGSISFTLMV